MKTKLLSVLCINILLFSLFCFSFQEKKIEIIPTKVVNLESRQKVIVIDAGHQKKANTKLEPIGPGAKQKKMKVTGGATGKYTKQKEYDLNLKVAKLLEKKLKAKGYRVIMIRTKNDVNISNSKRAKIANEAKADAFIRIHANADTSSKTNGVLTLCQTKNNKYNKKLYKKSYKLSKSIVKSIAKKTGAKDLGVERTDKMSGINWAQVPVTIVEMGFLTNKKEDKLLATKAYQKKIVNGIANGIDDFLNK